MAKHKKLKTIAFDVQGTLIDKGGNPRTPIIEILKELKRVGHTIIVWSAEDKQYILGKVSELGLEEFVDRCVSKSEMALEALSTRPEVAFDDQAEFPLGRETTILV